MPPVVFDLRSADDSRDVVHRAVQALAEGKLVAFPTETIYGLAASALVESAVERLLAVKGRSKVPVALAIKSAEDACDYVPDLSPLGRRLARRCWPGPVTLVVENHHPEGLVQQLPTAVRQAVAPDGWVALRVPAHGAIQHVLKLLAGPLALTSATRDGGPDSTTAAAVVSALDDQVQLVIDDGQTRFGQPSSIVRVREKSFELIRQGVVSEQVLKRLSSLMILFVCTGNTCRSPMAEIMCRKLLAERLGCPMAELPDRGVLVVSAGIAAMMGGRASTESVNVMAAQGLDLRDHESQPLTPQLVRHADYILTMTGAHRQAIIGEWPEASARTRVLCRSGADVTDPIGGTTAHYQRCADQIRAELTAWVKELPL
ncbi:MAG: threonylcarbamoyl-AMP synthase [Pirellulales bacterium]|nr:threonylcarbamoyl-AMP synthase [Pirellulales bacterium]